MAQLSDALYPLTYIAASDQIMLCGAKAGKTMVAKKALRSYGLPSSDEARRVFVYDRQSLTARSPVPGISPGKLCGYIRRCDPREQLDRGCRSVLRFSSRG